MLNARQIKNRYPGGNAFAEQDDFLFFGRQDDIEQLSSLIYVKPMTVLFGKSGYGKSSLINAGIVPLLKRSDEYLYFSVRFNSYQNKQSLLATPVQATIQKFLQATDVKTKLPLAQNSGNDTFWYWIKQIELARPPLQEAKFIIFFDQFEELFTYPPDQISQFSEQLSHLLYGRMPTKFRAQLDHLDEIGLIAERDYTFFNAKPEIKIVFSVRSDKLFLLNQLSGRLPAILENCYELKALSLTDAKLAINAPARLVNTAFRTPTFIFDPPAVEKIIATIIDENTERIEAATLQMICRYIEESLVIEQNKRFITEELLGDTTDFFQQYYQSVLNKFLDEEKSKVQHLIEDELINGDRRNALAKDYIKGRFSISEAALVNLEQSSLLRKDKDLNQRVIYEISHDSIVSAINKVAEVRRKLENEIQQDLLSKKVAEEQSKVQHLRSLNKKVKLGNYFLIVLSFLLIAFAITAFYFANKSKDDFKNYKDAQAKVRRSEMEKLKSQQLSRAIQLIRDADSYRRLHTSEYTDTACQRYHAALLIVMKYPDKTLNNEIKVKIAKTCLKK